MRGQIRSTLRQSRFTSSPVVATSIMFSLTCMSIFIPGMLQSCLAFTTPSVNSKFNYRLVDTGNSKINYKSSSISASQVVTIDGSAWASLRSFLVAENEGLYKGEGTENEKLGSLTIVTGSNSNSERMVGIQFQESNSGENRPTVQINGDGGKTFTVYEDSIAKIPESISEKEAIATCAASLGIHCAMYNPARENVVESVGGSNDKFDVSPLKANERKIVIMGSGDYASFLADGLSIIGANTTQISANKISTRKNAPSVNILPPAVGKLKLGFSTALKSFDCLVDTLTDETSSNSDLDFDGNYVRSSLLKLLKKENECDRYISTLSESQRIILDNGLIFGRKKADEYAKKTVKSQASVIIPPKSYGPLTLQKVLDGGIVFKGKQKNELLQGWSLKDFWEQSAWPRDSSGSATVRFGLPVVQDLESLTETVKFESDGVMKETMLSAPPKQAEDAPPTPKTPEDEFQGKKNPYITDIKDLDDLESEIVSPGKKCVLFLSARYCRTCKYLTPQYTRFARQQSEGDSDVMVARVDAGGKIGKAVGRHLKVSAVPAFVLFKDGEVYGDTLSISRLPSKKLDKAMELLSSGGKWDSKAVRNLD